MIILFEENIFFSASGFLKSGSQQNEGRVVRACPSSMLTFFLKKESIITWNYFTLAEIFVFWWNYFSIGGKKKRWGK